MDAFHPRWMIFAAALALAACDQPADDGAAMAPDDGERPSEETTAAADDDIGLEGVDIDLSDANALNAEADGDTAATDGAADSTDPTAAPAESSGMAMAPADDDPIARALSDSRRPAEDVERDANRKPGEVIAFAGTKPGDVVADLGASGGYYTRILSEVVGPTGKVYAFNAEEFSNFFPEPDPAAPLVAAYDNVEGVLGSFSAPQIPEPLDAAYIVLFYHDTHWDRVDIDTASLNKTVFDSLKPGGIYLVIDHNAEAGSGTRDVGTLHRIDPQVIKDEVTAAGFEFVGESDVLSNPDDDVSVSVFDPSIRGQTDRSVLKFRKPE